MILSFWQFQLAFPKVCYWDNYVFLFSTTVNESFLQLSLTFFLEPAVSSATFANWPNCYLTLHFSFESKGPPWLSSPSSSALPFYYRCNRQKCQQLWYWCSYDICQSWSLITLLYFFRSNKTKKTYIHSNTIIKYYFYSSVNKFGYFRQIL